MTQPNFYPICYTSFIDSFPQSKLYELGLGKRNEIIVKAIATDEFRPPKKGEWYLSEATLKAYCACSDFDIPYQIVKIVQVEKITTFKIIKEILNP